VFYSRPHESILILHKTQPLRHVQPQRQAMYQALGNSKFPSMCEKSPIFRYIIPPYD